jgi:hypothetical protein
MHFSIIVKVENKIGDKYGRKYEPEDRGSRRISIS